MISSALIYPINHWKEPKRTSKIIFWVWLPVGEYWIDRLEIFRKGFPIRRILRIYLPVKSYGK